MAFEAACSDEAGFRILVAVGNGEHTQVVEVLEEVETVLAAAVVVDVDLGIALQTGAVVIDMQMVERVGHHAFQVVVVGHAHRHVVRVGLAQEGLGVVGQLESILIPVERIDAGRIFHTVDMALGVAFVLKQFPAAANDLIGTGCDGRNAHGDASAWQHDGGSIDVIHGGHAALELDMDVQHMTLADGSDVRAIDVAFLIVILIDNSDDFLR